MDDAAFVLCEASKKVRMLEAACMRTFNGIEKREAIKRVAISVIKNQPFFRPQEQSND